MTAGIDICNCGSHSDHRERLAARLRSVGETPLEDRIKRIYSQLTDFDYAGPEQALLWMYEELQALRDAKPKPDITAEELERKGRRSV